MKDNDHPLSEKVKARILYTHTLNHQLVLFHSHMNTNILQCNPP